MIRKVIYKIYIKMNNLLRYWFIGRSYYKVLNKKNSESSKEEIIVYDITKEFIHSVKNDTFFLNPVQGYFYLGGLMSEKSKTFSRLDKSFHTKNRLLKKIGQYSSGVYIDFVTDADSIILSVQLGERMFLDNMSAQETTSFDVYTRNLDEESFVFVGNYYPTNISRTSFKEKIKFKNKRIKKVRIYFSSFTIVKYLFVGLDKGSTLCPLKEEHMLKVVAYGSSITQGCAASRPGLTYTAILGRTLNAQVFNLGFSESAKGDLEIANNIKRFDIIIVEYDHNSDLENLNRTHYNFYKQLRINNEGAYIILLSRLSAGLSISNSEMIERNRIIRTTFEKAVLAGDNDIDFIDGNSLLDNQDKSSFFVDKKHPNDKGMKIIADVILKSLHKKGLLDEENV